MYKLLSLVGIVLAILAACVAGPEKEKIVLEKTKFSSLEEWGHDNQSEALKAFLRSCEKFAAFPDDKRIGNGEIAAGKARDWKNICTRAKNIPLPEARTFFEQEFQPFIVKNNNKREGLFTGYYEVALKGSRTKQGAYTTPLHSKPNNFVKLNINDFVKENKKTELIGRVDDGWLKPFPDREGILKGTLGNEVEELVYVDDPVQAFFLHIQGSGRVLLDDGSVMQVGFADRNGHNYVAIGKVLIDSGAFSKGEANAENIKHWLREHPEKADAIMNSNPSYIFFREIKGDGPIGAQGVALTAERSIAVDRKYIPYGVPVWLETTAPALSETEKEQKFSKLMIAQDTGGAIKGPVRGDVFFGYGDKAEKLANHMKQKGYYYVLLPKGI